MLYRIELRKKSQLLYFRDGGIGALVFRSDGPSLALPRSRPWTLVAKNQCPYPYRTDHEGEGSVGSMLLGQHAAVAEINKLELSSLSSEEVWRREGI